MVPFLIFLKYFLDAFLTWNQTWNFLLFFCSQCGIRTIFTFYKFSIQVSILQCQHFRFIVIVLLWNFIITPITWLSNIKEIFFNLTPAWLSLQSCRTIVTDPLGAVMMWRLSHVLQTSLKKSLNRMPRSQIQKKICDEYSVSFLYDFISKDLK